MQLAVDDKSDLDHSGQAVVGKLKLSSFIFMSAVCSVYGLMWKSVVGDDKRCISRENEWIL